MIADSRAETCVALERADLTMTVRDELLALLSLHFDGVSAEQFEHDLQEKNWVILLRRSDRLVGFTTLLATTSQSAGSSITVIYSGDTIVAPEAWDSTALARTWIHTVNRIRAPWPGRRCYWLLLSSGFRTYRFLPVFWREFYPRFDAPMPRATETLLAQLARERYGDQFDARTGLVRLHHPQRLKGRLRDVPPERTANPHIAFFLERNPFHFAGDELVCLTEIAEYNLTRAGQRMVARG